LILGNSIIRLNNVDSTNNYAKSLLKENKSVAEGTVIIAEMQEQGRGQYGNIWVSEDGMNLTFSIVLYPKFLKASEQFLLSQAVSLGIVDCLKNHISVPVSIKWPNDILIEKQKVCGILIENNIMKDNLSECIVGIGLNVNQTVFPEYILNAASLKLIFQKNFDLENLLHEMLGCIEKYYLKLMQGHLDLIRESYLQNLFQYKTAAVYRIKNETVSGGIVGVNEMGQLQLRVGNELITLNNKEVEFLVKE
jgi:BirA family transcriptional regulator, biotin operon repressor / biotin---[acetyl-CoA-carboxylase] ligase